MINSRIETLILNNLLHNEQYCRRVIPYLKDYHFLEKPEALLFMVIKAFLNKYNNLPTKQAILIELESKKDQNQPVFEAAMKYVRGLEFTDEFQVDRDWLTDKSEEFCKNREMMYAIHQSVEIIKDPKKQGGLGKITDLVREALCISFDPSIGHDYLEDAEERYEHYASKVDRILIGLEQFDKITDGGLPAKTLTTVMGGPGAGKTMTLCNFAASFLSQGKNVLYITMEMSHFEISRRIDANLHDVGMKEFKHMSRHDFLGRIDSLKRRVHGKLKIKEYPSCSANVNHFRALIADYKLKKAFTPDVIIIDYLGIISSAALEGGARASNSNAYIAGIAQEVRGLAQEMNLRIITAHQLNREGMKAKEINMEHTADSMGVPRESDLFVVLIPTEDPKRIKVKQLKNRFNDQMENTVFYIGVDRAKQRFFDLEEGQPDLEEGEDVPGFDKTPFGMAEGNGRRMTKTSISESLREFKGRGKYTN